MPNFPKLIMQFKSISTNSGFLVSRGNQHSYNNFLLSPASCAVPYTASETETSSRTNDDASITISYPSHPTNYPWGEWLFIFFFFKYKSSVAFLFLMWHIKVGLAPDIRVTLES